MTERGRVYHPADRDTRDLFAGGRVNFTHATAMTLAEWRFEAGAQLPEHSHPHEQISMLLSGEFELTVSGEVYRLLPGSTVVIPSNVRHSGRAIADAHLIDVFHPVREDYR